MESESITPLDPDELDRLVLAMAPSQKLRFKQAVVRQAIHFVSQRLPPQTEDNGHRDGIRAATAWLSEPTEEQAQAAAVFATASCWDGGARYHDYPVSFLDPAWVAGETDVCKSAKLAVNTAPPTDRIEARQWQLKVARSILAESEEDLLGNL